MFTKLVRCFAAILLAGSHLHRNHRGKWDLGHRSQLAGWLAAGSCLTAAVFTFIRRISLGREIRSASTYLK